MIHSILLLLCSLLTISVVLGQSTGVVEYKHLGIQFTIPNGWVGQEVAGGYLIGSQTEPGFAFITTHEAKTLEEIRSQAEQGIIDENGTNLMLSGTLEKISGNSIGSDFEGTLEGQPVTAYILGMLNTTGYGLLIMAATSPEQYSAFYKQLALQIANSVIFSKPEALPVAEQWKQKFSNARLTYMDSYHSSGPSYDGYSTGGGYSSQTQIHLCAQGYFKYKSSSSMSIDTGGAFGSSSDNNSGDGTWEITSNIQGEAVLKLNFHNGETHQYTLAYQDNKTYLNGDRYFVTYGNDSPEYRPDCF